MGRTFHVKAGSFDAPVPGADEPAEATDPTLETFRLLVDLAKLLRSAVDILVRPTSRRLACQTKTAG